MDASLVCAACWITFEDFLWKHALCISHELRHDELNTFVRTLRRERFLYLICKSIAQALLSYVKAVYVIVGDVIKNPFWYEVISDVIETPFGVSLFGEMWLEHFLVFPMMSCATMMRSRIDSQAQSSYCIYADIWDWCWRTMADLS